MSGVGRRVILMDMNNYKIVLASSSPSRRLLFERAGIPCEVVVSGADETIEDNLPADEIVMTLALRKNKAVRDLCPGKVIISADSLVFLDGQIMGKPDGNEGAYEMLSFLSGKTHTIFTGVNIFYNGKEKTCCEATEVTFFPLSDMDIKDYISSGEPIGKAGSYGIEGKGILLIEKINGDYSNIVGLPLSRTMREISSLVI